MNNLEILAYNVNIFDRNNFHDQEVIHDKKIIYLCSKKVINDIINVF